MIDLVILTEEQNTTISQAFKVEHLKDEMALNKQFNYDFDDLDEE